MSDQLSDVVIWQKKSDSQSVQPLNSRLHQPAGWPIGARTGSSLSPAQNSKDRKDTKGQDGEFLVQKREQGW